jgi:hypothetical protein
MRRFGAVERRTIPQGPNNLKKLFALGSEPCLATWLTESDFDVYYHITK